MAAASIIQRDHSLEERIYLLQKRDLSAGARQTLEEASQLLGDGRHIEASALVDKAEAMISLVSPIDANRGAASQGNNDIANPEQPWAAGLVRDLASGLAKVLVGAIQNLEQHVTGETRQLTLAFSERLDRIQSTVECLQPLTERIESLVETGVVTHQRFEQLTVVTTSLQEAASRHDAEIGAMRSRVEELSSSTGDRMNGICQRMEEQERQISAANNTTSELSTKIAFSAERLERHAAAIRALHHEQRQRASALDQIAEVLGRVQTAGEAAEAIAAV